MGTGMSATDSVRKLESIVRWTNTLLFFVFLWDVLTNNKNIEYNQPYPLINSAVSVTFVIITLKQHWGKHRQQPNK